MLQIPDWMDFHADVRPGDTALVTPRLTLTFGQLRAAAVAVALKLEEEGVKRGQKVAVQSVSPALQLVLMLALHRLGAVACMLPQEPVRRKAGLESITFDWHLTDHDEKLSSARVMPVSLEWLTELKLTEARRPGGFKKPDELCLIVMSSGTTSAPKPMGFTVDMMEKRVVTRSLGDQGCQRGEKVLIMAGLGAMNGIHHLLGVMWCGGCVYLGHSAENSAEIIAEERINRLFTTAPLLARTLEAVNLKAYDVSCLRQIYAGGDSLAPALVQQVMKRMCANFLTGFSTNEVGRIALYSFQRAEIRPNEVGHIYPWAEVEAVDEKDKVLPPGKEGHLRFRSPAMIDGYIDNPEATKERFRHGWFYSDDIGWVTPAGMLVLTGRAKDFIHAAAGRINPARIDHAFHGHPKLAEAAGFGVRRGKDGDEIWLAVVPRVPVYDAELSQIGRERLGKFAPQHILRVNRLPRNEGNKVVRRQLAELVVKDKTEA